MMTYASMSSKIDIKILREIRYDSRNNTPGEVRASYVLLMSRYRCANLFDIFV